MLSKIISIERLGGIQKLNSVGDVAFRNLTLIAGSNGSGKSTIAAALRDLARNSIAELTKRQSLGASAPAHVDLLFDNSQRIASSSNWKSEYPICVFDAVFVAENVYLYEGISRDHKKRLIGLILGTEANQLRERIDSIDTQIRELNRKLLVAGSSLESYAKRASISIDKFIALPHQDSIESKIEAAKLVLEAANSYVQILNATVPGKIDIPQPNAEIEPLLKRTFDDVTEDTIKGVTAHLDRLGINSQQWILSGLSYSESSNDCPFCGLDLRTSTIIQHLRNYFRSEIREFLAELAVARTRVLDEFSDSAIDAISLRIETHHVSTEYWQTYLPSIPPSQFDTELLRNALTAYREVAINLLDIKAADLGESIDLAKWDEAVSAYANFCATWENANQIATSSAEAIEDLRTRASSASSSARQSELDLLLATKDRFDHTIDANCKLYIELMSQKEALDTEKQAKKDELNCSVEESSRKFGKATNEILEKFGVVFRLDRPRPSFVGGQTSLDYELKLGSYKLNQKSDASGASFTDAFSQGDKFALGLAFFFASLSDAVSSTGGIVVLDDPFTSLDTFRRSSTIELILGLLSKHKQVILLSHDTYFLKQVERRAVRQNITPKTLKLERLAEFVSMSECDLEQETRAQYFNDCELLRRFHEGKENIEANVAGMSMRPILEYGLRVRYPSKLNGTDTLGEMLKKLREEGLLASGSNPYNELDDLNNYTSQFHHKNELGSGKYDANEVRTYAARVLSFVSRVA